MLVDCSWLKQPYQTFAENALITYEPILISETTACPKATVAPWPGQPPTNSTFPVYFPKSHFKGESTDIIIVINGWLERQLSSLKLYESETWSLASQLCNEHIHLSTQLSRNIACVFLPLPYHYWRLPVTTNHPDKEPAFCVYKQPELLFNSFCGIYDDIFNVIEAIGNHVARTYHCDAAQCRFHLLGYSLGGLASLGVFLADRKLSRRLASCHLLASGVPLTGIEDISAIHIKAGTQSSLLDNAGFRTTELRSFVSKLISPELDKTLFNIVATSGSNATKVLYDIYRHHILGCYEVDHFSIDNVIPDGLIALHYYCAAGDMLFSSEKVRTYSLISFDDTTGAFLTSFDWRHHILADRPSAAGWHANGSAQLVAGYIRDAILATKLPQLSSQQR